MKNYYKILGVLDDAEDIVIRAAYKALAQRYHPDKWNGNEEEANSKMSDINEAYGVLSDKSKRKKYDSEFLRDKNKSKKYDRDTKSEFEKKEESTKESDQNSEQSHQHTKNSSEVKKLKFTKLTTTFFLSITLIFAFYLWLNSGSNSARNKKTYDFYARENPSNCQSNFQKNPRMTAEFTYNKETNKIFMRMDFHKTNEQNLIFEMEQCRSIVNLDNWSCGGIESTDGISPIWKMTNGQFTYTEGYKRGSPILCNEKIIERF